MPNTIPCGGQMQSKGTSKWDIVEVENDEMEIKATQVQETRTSGGVSSLVNSNQDDDEEPEREEATGEAC